MNVKKEVVVERVEHHGQVTASAAAVLGSMRTLDLSWNFLASGSFHMPRT